MANPADDLYEIFTTWRSTTLDSGGTPTVKLARFLIHRDAEEQEWRWKMLRRATRCIEGIAQIIDLMERSGDDVTAERRYFQEWVETVFAYPKGWEDYGSGVSDLAYSTLQLFRNSARRFVPELEPGAIDELRKLLENEPDLTPPPGHYPIELYEYFTKVKFHLKNCIDDYSVTNAFDLQRAAEDYRAAVFMMANGNFVVNPEAWGRHAAATFVATKAKNFGLSLYNEATNQLTKATLRQLEGPAQHALEAGKSLLGN